jgi:hypothetical protein
VELATPPRGYNARGEAVFWIGDTAVLALEAPKPAAAVTVVLHQGTNSYGASVQAAPSRFAHVCVQAREAGVAGLAVTGERGASLELKFIQRLTREELLEQLTKTPRVRVWVGEIALEAWCNSRRKIPVNRVLPEVRVDLGAEAARARVTVWERGKQRSSRGLHARSAARFIADALPTASRIELDADNFGRVEIIPTRGAVGCRGRSATSDRLVWFDHVVSLSVPPEQHATTTLLAQPRASTSLAVRRVGAAALVRGRRALRRRHEAGGDG